MSIASLLAKAVSIYHMNNDAWVDALGNNDGTASGAIFSTTSPAPILGSHSGLFDSINDKVSTGNTGLDKDKGSFSFWFAPERAGNDNQNWIIFMWGINEDGVNRILFIKRSDNTLSLEISGITNALLDVSGWAADSIHHIVGTWNSGTQKFYVDGDLINTKSYVPLTGKRPTVYINGNNQLYAGGVYDEVIYFNDVLTDGGVSDGQTAGGEVAELWNGGAGLELGLGVTGFPFFFGDQ
jgi:hypothetical protein